MSKFYCIFILFLISNSAHSADWSYEDDQTGPAHWGQIYPTCNGKFQSPIDINPKSVTPNSFSPLAFFNFNSIIPLVQVTNNGHTAVFNISKGRVPEISGGPLDGPYKFQQFHFHWGRSDTSGSEGSIGNRSYAMELHMVFYREASGSFAQASTEVDGLCVLAFQFQAFSNNPNLEVMTREIPNIKAYHSTVLIQNFPAFENIFNKHLTHYYAYKGSLTTPPCSEVVTWIEFPEPIPISHNQVDVFRDLLDEHSHLLDHNIRPSQPLNGRTIFVSPVH